MKPVAIRLNRTEKDYSGVPIYKIPRTVRRANIQIALAGKDILPKTMEILMRPLEDEFVRYKKNCG